MGRQENISKAILRAVSDEDHGHGKKKTHLKRILYFFNIINISLIRFQSDTFSQLRRHWQFDDKDYRASFQSDSLDAAGDLGYSGSVRTLP
jgi:hypothetical protein